MNVHEIAVVEVEEAPSPTHSHLANIKKNHKNNQNFYSSSIQIIQTLHNHKSSVNTHVVLRKKSHLRKHLISIGFSLKKVTDYPINKPHT